MRLMLTRPPTLRVLPNGAEQFRCADIASGTVLSRESCAARYRSEERARFRQSAISGPHAPAALCAGCPVGAIHAAELGERAWEPHAPLARRQPVVRPVKTSRPVGIDLADPSPVESVPAGPASGAPAAAQGGATRAPRRRPGGYAKGDARAAANGRKGGARPRITITHPATGETLTITEWAARLDVPREQIEQRRARGLPPERVLAGYVRPDLASAQRQSALFRASAADAKDRARVTALTHRIATARHRLARMEQERAEIMARVERGMSDAAE